MLAACSRREVKIEVVIPGPDSVDAPVARLGLVALPYDRDSVIAALEAKHPRPAAITHQLDSLFQAFRAPFAVYASAAYRVQTLEQSLGRLRLRLDSLPRASATYDSLYRDFTRLTDSVATARDRRRDGLEELAIARASMGFRIDSLRQLMSGWEDSTYRGYDSITKALGSGLGNAPIADSTGADGRVTIRLPAGRWWIYARSWDAWDPNSEWYWNVPATGDRLVLDRSNGRRLPRY
jgi:hypothetical protein